MTESGGPVLDVTYINICHIYHQSVIFIFHMNEYNMSCE